MPAKIYLIRHGETDYNRQRRMQGWLDIPLNDSGHSQARATALALTNHKIHAIYSSDLKRAHQTAKPIAENHKLEITLTPHLRERDMGIFSGWAWETERDEEKDALWPGFEHARDHNELDWDAHRGETLRQFSARIDTMLKHIQNHHAGEHVALVTHGGTINRIFEDLDIKKTIEGFRMVGNGAVYVLVKENTSYVLGDL